MTPELQEEIARAMWDHSSLQPWDGPAQPGSMMITEFDRQVYRDHARAVAPIIARLVAAEREACAAVAYEHAAELAGKIDGSRRHRSDFDIGLFESAISEANAIAAAIHARGSTA